MKRRDFLIQSLTAVSGAMLAACGRQSASIPPIDGFDPYEPVTLGSTGIRASRLGIGTGTNAWQRVSNQTRLGAAQFHALIRSAYNRGIRLFDVADLYGSHQYLAAALADVPRDSYAIATKIWYRPDGLPESSRPDADLLVERFCHELKTDYIDLVLLHCVAAPDWNTQLSSQMSLLDNLKRKGTIRAHGVSCHSLGAIVTAAGEPWVDSVHARINAYGDSMDGPPGRIAPVLEQIHTAGKAVLGMKIVGAGHYTDRPDKLDYTLNYVLALRTVDAMIVGFQQPAQIDDLAARIRNISRTTRPVPPMANDAAPHTDDSELSNRVGIR